MIGLDLSSKGQIHESFNAALAQYGFIDKLYCLESHKKRLQTFAGFEALVIRGIPDWIAYFRVVRFFLVILIIITNFKKRLVFLTIEVEHFLLLPLLSLVRGRVLFFSHSLPMRYESSVRTRKFLRVVFHFLNRSDKNLITCIVHKSAAMASPFATQFALEAFDVVCIPHPIVELAQDIHINRRLNIKRRVMFLGVARKGKGFRTFQTLSDRCSSYDFIHAFDRAYSRIRSTSTVATGVKNVEITGALAENITSKDIVFNMYDQTIYHTVPSGVLFDAVSAKAWILQYKNSNLETSHRHFFCILDVGDGLELVKQRGHTFGDFVRKEYQSLKTKITNG